MCSPSDTGAYDTILGDDPVKQTGGQPGTAKIGGEILSDEQAGLWVALLVPEVTCLGFTRRGGSPQCWLFATDGWLDTPEGELWSDTASR